jgi:dipeptidyl aminopeptidase/acylaminoacyl peptidase
MNTLKHIGLILALLATKGMLGQMPDTDIWMFDVHSTYDSAKRMMQYSFANALNFTNRPGYDNQPVFSPDGKSILYTSYREDGQSDIYRYDIVTKTTSAFCKTPESEYSPAFTPDGKYVSVVRVEKDSTQRLWKFPVKGGAPVLVMKDVAKIGYYAWINSDSLLVFLLTNPESLQAVDVKTQKLHFLAAKPGRCFYASEKGVTYLSKADSANWRFDYINYSGIKNTQLGLCKPPAITPDHEDFLQWMNEEATLLFMGKGSILFQYYPSQNSNRAECKALQDFSSLGLKNITRLAISKDGKKIAIVGSH